MGKPMLPGDTKDDPAQVFTLEKWGTLNTKASRTAIADNEFSYLMNFFPVGDGNLRTLYAEGGIIYGATGGKTILYRYMFNLKSVTYAAVFLSDGTAYQVKTSDGSVTTISAVASTFSDGVVIPSCAQHGADNIIIVSKVSTSAYWIWDGAHLFGAGTLGFLVVISDGGPNAKYTSAPTVTAFGGHGSGATFTATVASGVVTKVALNNPGSGYLLNDQVVLRFSGGGSDDGAALVAQVTTSSGGVSSALVTNPGRLDTGNPAAGIINFTGGGGSGATGLANIIDNSVQSITITNPGKGYTSAPTLTVTGNSTFAGVAIITQGQVTGTTISAGGTNYQTPPIVTIAGDGTGAEAHAVVTAGAVSSIVIDNAGTGYTYAKATVSGGNNAAQATIEIMPFGLAGDTVEIYQQRVWVGDQDKYLFSAPESLANFSASAGGGAVPINDSFTRYKVTKFIQNNFLYRLCDSSVNVISNVQTAGVPATTSFNDENVDPQVGTSWPNSVAAFGRATMFANPTGVYALFGGAAQKVSDQLDGLFANASFNTGASGITPSAAVFNLFSIKVYGILFTTIDPYTGNTANIIAIWDGKKWFLATQIATLKAITTQEIDSKIVAYGDDGTNLYPLFQSPSTSLTKTAQTKLSQINSYLWFKQGNRFYVLAQTNDGNVAEFFIGIDTEKGAGTLTTADNVVGALEFLGSDQQPLVFDGMGGAPITWTVASLVLYGFRVGIHGRLIGVTAQTIASDATLISMTGEYVPHYAPYA